MWEALAFAVVVLVVVVPLVPAYVLLATPVVMACRRQLSWPSLVLWVLSVVLLSVWAVRNWQFNERADVEGTAGDALAAWEWLLAAVAVATASLAVLRARGVRTSVAPGPPGAGAPPPHPARGGRVLALTGLACAAASALVLPELLGPVAVVLGVVAHRRGDRLGRFVVGAGIVGAVLPVVLLLLLSAGST